MDCCIRFALESDIPVLKTMDPWPKEPLLRRKIAGNEVLVAEIQGKVIGLARYSALWATVPFLELIFIKKNYRGKGLSWLMLDFLCRELKKEGYTALLSSSQTDEPEPQKWHIHMGFASNGIIENIADEGIGEVVFRKVL